MRATIRRAAEVAAAAIALAGCSGVERTLDDESVPDRPGMRDGGIRETGESVCTRSAQTITTSTEQALGESRSVTQIVQPGSSFEYGDYTIEVGDMAISASQYEWAGNTVSVRIVMTATGEELASGSVGSSNLGSVRVGNVELTADYVLGGGLFNEQRASLTLTDYTPQTAIVSSTVDLIPSGDGSCASSEMVSVLKEMRVSFPAGLTPEISGDNLELDLGELGTLVILGVDAGTGLVSLGQPEGMELLNSGESASFGSFSVDVESVHIASNNVLYARVIIRDDSGEPIATTEPLPDSGYRLGYLVAEPAPYRFFDSYGQMHELYFTPVVNGNDGLSLIVSANRVAMAFGNGEALMAADGSVYDIAVERNAAGTAVTGFTLTRRD